MSPLTVVSSKRSSVDSSDSTLHDLVLASSGRVPAHLLQRWAGQIFEAVFSLHSRGLTHVDLKPENLMIVGSGDVVLTYVCEWACVLRYLLLKLFISDALN